ncbi:hypothetical protein [Massilia endophytica]|uniref:hypothetical protein n=1 Tax=Massilia endophytica TaxID=2899220 RepID=UPI001E651285|nr:hypothetical protein [Massilia endophytica]UGQ49345.1 hypothetical protein LSQ66_03780 [Massilia endophytica]
MDRMKRSLFLPLSLAMLPLAAAGQGAPDKASIEAYARLPVCKLTPDGRKLAVEPCRTAAPKRPMPRRPVPQAVEPVARMAVPQPMPHTQEGPVLPLVLTPRPPATATPPSLSSNPAPGAFAAPPPGPSAPMPALCGAGGCRDAATGTFYGGGPGVTVSPSGRQCVTSSSGLVQCF